MIRLSAGSAALLGLIKIKCDTLPTTAYLMLGENCTNNCSFCPQGCNSPAKKDFLSRVTWPAFSQTQLQASLTEGQKKGLCRICLQVVRQKGKECITTVRDLKKISALPISVSISPSSFHEVEEIIEAGAERVSIALDAANPNLYLHIKKGSFLKRLGLLEKSAVAYPGKINTHLIVGLGETDQELVILFSFLLEKRITLGLFAFQPVKGTPLEKHPPPPLERYRTLQTAFFLMEKGLIGAKSFAFNQGRLVSLGLSAKNLRTALTGGQAFETLGCPGCNRPYYNERPGGPLYNCPRPLTDTETEAAFQAVQTYLEEGNTSCKNGGSW